MISRRERIAVAGLCVGNFLEFYNFGVYAFFAPMIAKAFFPSHDGLMGLFMALMTFAAGFLSRPLGALVLGAYARRQGDKAALQLTLTMMAAGTATLCFMPGYGTAGIAAPIVILLGRLLQGFSEGGEVGPATAMLFDLEGPHGRGGIVCMQYVTQLLASLAGVAVGVVLSLLLDRGQIFAWGWRLPFLLGLLIVPAGLVIRRIAVHPQPGATTPAVPHPGAPRLALSLALVMVMMVCGTIANYLRAFGVSYAVSVLHLAPGIAMAGMCGGLVIGLVMVVVGMKLTRRTGLPAMLGGTTLLSCVLCWPLYHYANTAPGLASQLLLNGTFFGLTSLPVAATWRRLLGVFPRDGRALAFGLIYATAVSVFGGFTQPVVTWLIARLHDPMVPAWIILATAPVGTIAFLLIPGARPEPAGGSTAAIEAADARLIASAS